MRKIRPMRLFLPIAAQLGMLAAANAQTAPAGFYVRGEVGGGFGQSVTFTDSNPSAANCDLCGAKLPATVNTSVLFGGGVGYRFTPAIRADLTVDDFPSFRASGTTTQPGNPSGSVPFSDLLFMANGYVDLNGLYPNGFGPWQPYVTAGVGVARNDLGQFSGVLSSGPFVGTPVSENGATRTNFAWGAGIGIGYAVTPQWTVQIGYEFYDLGELLSGPVGTVGGVSSLGTASKSTDFDVHTLTAGVRFAF
jgi:opacity protein-like surface antigen